MRAKSKHRRFAGKFFWFGQEQALPAAAQPVRRIKIAKFRARDRVGRIWRDFPRDMKPRLILVTNRDMNCDCIMQPGHKPGASKPGDDISKQEGLLLLCVMTVSNHDLEQNIERGKPLAIIWQLFDRNCGRTGRMDGGRPPASQGTASRKKQVARQPGRD